jgi:TolB-like protein/class 3 adenylate cyclase/cytochrome c-type biogenesis protein CcmH/NrfG
MTEERAKRKLSAVLSADVKGYSRLMGQDEAGTVDRLKEYRVLMTDLIQQYRGRVVDSPGDNIFAEFASVVDATECAVKVQEELNNRNAELPDDSRMAFRIGINLGDVIEDGERIYGDGVNIAARIESLAEGGGVCISGTSYDQVKNKLNLGYENLGEHRVKNIDEPVRVYRVLTEPEAAGKVIGERRKAKRGLVLAAAILLIVAVGGAAGWYFYLRQPTQIDPASVEKMAYPLPDKPSIAVLPFDNLSGVSDEDYLADGITENIITALSYIPEIFVIARNSTFTYKGKAVRAQEVAEDLGVRYILEGSVQRAGGRLRITAQLIDATTGRHLWADRYDRDLQDLFALQDEITLKIVSALEVKLSVGVQTRLTRKTMPNFEAWSYYVRGYGHMKRHTKDDNTRARELFERAASLAPEYAPVFTALGLTHFDDARHGWSESREASLLRAVELAKKAQALDDSDPMIHVLWGAIYLRQGRYDQAIAEGEKSVALGPNQAYPHIMLAMYLTYHTSRYKEALPLVRKAMRLDPYYPSFYLELLGHLYLSMEAYEKAVEAFKVLVVREPHRIEGRLGLAVAYIRRGLKEQARSAVAEVLRLYPGYSLEVYRKQLDLMDMDPAAVESLIKALREAGLPEYSPTALSDKPSIAVLPFANLSADPEQEYFSDGMTDDLITDLSKISGLLVIARNSVFTYKGKPVKIQQVAGDLGVRYVLEGSIRKAGDQVRINAQLIDATTGHHLWAERYDGVMDNIFDLQDKITSKIVSALALKLTAAEQEHTKRKETDNIEAFDAFLKGWEHYQRFTPEDFSKAISLFKRAIDLDPNYGRAYAALALTYWMGTGQGGEWRTRAGIHLETHRLWARHYLQMAMKKPTSVAHQVASLFALYRRQHESTIAEAEKALALEPNDIMSHLAMGRALIYAGRPQEATNFFNKAMLLDPHNIDLPLYYLGLAHFCLGKLDEAASFCERALTHNPELMSPTIVLAATYAHIGRDQEAENMLKRLLKGEQFIPDIYAIMYMFPFKDLEVSDRFAGGLIKAGAGLLGEALDYPKISKKNKLNGDEIKNLIFGRSITATSSGYEWKISFTKNGKVNRQASWDSASGTYWIEGDQLWIQWKYKYEGLKWGSDIHRNPSGTAETKNEYLYVTDWNIVSFSVVEKKD